MVITYYGASCFKVQSGETVLAFNPPSKESEYKSPRFASDIVLVSSNHKDYNGWENLPGKAEGGKPFVADGQGEYEISGIYIKGIGSNGHGNTVYSSGLANKAQLRTHVLSNGSVVWDLAGNITEWTDAYVNGTADQMVGTAGEWTSVTDFNNLNYARPQNPSWTSANGIGRFKNSTVQAGFERGGNRGNGAVDGIYTLYLDDDPNGTGWYIGFRCAR